MTGIDPALARALNAVQPPPLSEDFDARLFAAIDRDGETPLPRMRSRARPGVKGWRRSRNLALGVVAFSLVSAAAAATGILGEKARNLPVIASIAEKIAPRPKAKPHALAARRVAPAKPQDIAEPATVPATEMQTIPLGNGRLREAIHSRRVERRQERRAVVREALGLAPSGERLTPSERQRLRAMPVEERRALLARLREARRERLRALREARSNEPAQADQSTAAPTAAAMPALQPGERLRRWREWRRARRESLDSEAQ